MICNYGVQPVLRLRRVHAKVDCNPIHAKQSCPDAERENFCNVKTDLYDE
jgi:hypothetical protein